MKRCFVLRELRFPKAVFIFTFLLSVSSLLGAQTQANSLAYLSKHIGENSVAVLKTQPLQRRIIALIGATEYKSLVFNTDVANPLTQEGNVLYFAGNAPHRGREEEGAVMIDTVKDSVEVFLLHNATTVRGWAENNKLVAIPKEVQEVLNNWPRTQLVQTMSTMRQGASSTAAGTPGSTGRSSAAPASAPARSSADDRPGAELGHRH